MRIAKKKKNIDESRIETNRLKTNRCREEDREIEQQDHFVGEEHLFAELDLLNNTMERDAQSIEKQILFRCDPGAIFSKLK